MCATARAVTSRDTDSKKLLCGDHIVLQVLQDGSNVSRWLLLLDGLLKHAELLRQLLAVHGWHLG